MKYFQGAICATPTNLAGNDIGSLTEDQSVALHAPIVDAANEAVMKHVAQGRSELAELCQPTELCHVVSHTLPWLTDMAVKLESLDSDAGLGRIVVLHQSNQ